MQSRLKSISNIFALFVLLLSLFGSSVNITPAYAAGIVVNTAVDENGTGAGCSLREAITAANTNAAYGGCPAGAGSDTITFAGNYTITLVGSQLPTVTTVITITGNGAANTIIQASTCNPVTLPGGCSPAAYLVFDVTGGNLTLNGLTVRHGQGGIYNNVGMLRLTGVSVEANSANFGAGIVNSSGTVVLHESLLANNLAASFGGAVANSSGTLHVVNSTISGNAANGIDFAGGGGAIDSYGSAPVMTFYNSTITNNSAVAPNTAKSGIWREAGTSFFVNSIIANNNGANNCFRSGGSGTTIAGSNIENGNTCGLGGQNADPMLIPLAENGGLTQTHALLPGSPAINLGDTSWAVAEDEITPLTTDQRGAGYPRIRGASVDMGAYESACIGGPYSVPAGDAPALIEAITCANAKAANDVINLTNSTYTLTLQSAFEVGLPPIVTAATGGTLTINGNGATIQRSSAVGIPNFHLFSVNTGANLTLDRVTLANGYAQVGGAIFSDGMLTITNSTIRNNYALAGGAISQSGGASTTIMNSLIANNQAESYGGVIDMSSGTLFIINSTLSGNQTLGSDPGYGGGAIDAYNTPTITIINSTIANNTSPQAARSGIWLENGTLTIANSIAANNNGANNCVITGALIDNGGNLDNGTTCGFGGLVGQNTNPLLGPLANNGGPTQTMALLSGSPAINAGDDADCEATDQRGVARPQGSHCDIGAYEANGGGDTTGVFRPGNGLLYLKNANTTGFADVAINYGTGGDYPIAGDWNGDGTATIGIYRNGSFYLRNSNTLGFADIVFAFGTPGDQPVAGDWDGDGVDTIGVYSNGQFLLRNSNSAGAANMSFFLGNPGDVGIAGDWNGDGMDTTGVFRPSNGIIFLKNANTTGFADIALNYGLAGDMPVTGDWNNDGIDTIGVYRNAQFLLRNSNTIGFAEIVFGLGNPGDMPISGNWDGIP